MLAVATAASAKLASLVGPIGVTFSSLGWRIAAIASRWAFRTAGS
jgi:uncharacterized protein YaaW (UPF0174 family)